MIKSRVRSAIDLFSYYWPTNSELLLNNSRTRADLFRFEQTINNGNTFEDFSIFDISAIARKKSYQKLDCFAKNFVTFFKRQNDVTPSNAITDVTFDHFSAVNDVKTAHTFRTVTLFFHITRFFNIGYIGARCVRI